MITKNTSKEQLLFKAGDWVEYYTPDYLFYYRGVYCGGFSISDNNYIYNVAIKPRFWNLGAGTAMMQEITSFFTKELYLKTCSPKAFHIYQKVGFKIEFVSGGWYNMKYERN